MGKSSPPAPPNPKETSAASTSTNVGTAVANAYLGNVNQNTPDGSLNYSQTGMYDWHDPYTNQTYKIPTFTATQTLSPGQQNLHDIGLQTQTNLANTAQEQSSFIRDLLNHPVDLSTSSVENHLYDLAMNRLQPQLDQRRAATETDLINRGIRPGSDAYDRAHTTLDQGENDLFNQLYLSGRGQAVQELLTQHSQPINEITALLSGSQVTQPNFVNSNMPTIPTTDVAGIINQNYRDRLGIWQMQNQQQQQMLGGLFGLGAGMLRVI